MRIWPKPCHLICCELKQRAYVTVEAGEVSAVHRWCGTLKIQVIQGQQTVQWKTHFQSTDTWKEVGSCSPHPTSKSFQSANTSKSFWINAQVGSSRRGSKCSKKHRGRPTTTNGLTRSGQDANMPRCQWDPHGPWLTSNGEAKSCWKILMATVGSVSKPCTPGEHQNSW